MSKSYLGIDVHKKWCVYTEIDSTGKVIRQSRFGNTFEEVSIFASSRRCPTAWGMLKNLSIGSVHS